MGQAGSASCRGKEGTSLFARETIFDTLLTVIPVVVAAFSTKIGARALSSSYAPTETAL